MAADTPKHTPSDAIVTRLDRIPVPKDDLIENMLARLAVVVVVDLDHVNAIAKRRIVRSNKANKQGQY